MDDDTANFRDMVNTVRPAGTARLVDQYAAIMPDGRRLEVTLHEGTISYGTTPTRWLLFSLRPRPGALWYRHGVRYTGCRLARALDDFTGSKAEAATVEGATVHDR